MKRDRDEQRGAFTVFQKLNFAAVTSCGELFCVESLCLGPAFRVLRIRKIQADNLKRIEGRHYYI